MSRLKPTISIEALGRQDLPAALSIQAETYPTFLIEDEDTFLSRINRTASYCLAAKHGEELLGYLLAHSWRRQSPPPLGTVLPDDVPSEVLFIHDLAVSSAYRGLMVGQRLITRAFELAAQDGLRSAELIAVEGAADYWRRLGFVEGEVSRKFLEKLGTYGPSARWMTCEVPLKR